MTAEEAAQLIVDAIQSVEAAGFGVWGSHDPSVLLEIVRDNDVALVEGRNTGASP